MGYVQTVVTVSESDGVAQLTVSISMSPEADPIETSFFLLLNTSDGTATGLLCLWSLPCKHPIASHSFDLLHFAFAYTRHAHKAQFNTYTHALIKKILS